MRTRSLLLVIPLLAGCPPAPGGSVDPPPLLTILPAAPTTVDALTVDVEPPADASFGWLNWDISWQLDGAAHPASDGSTSVAASATARGQSWTVTLTSNQDGSIAVSDAVTIVNTPPSMSFANLDPVAPRSDEAITALVGGWEDPDGDAESYSFAWLVDDQDIGAPDAATLAPGSYSSGQTVSAVVTPTDGLDDGTPITTAGVVIANGAPSTPVVTITPDDADDTQDLLCSVTADDPDGDALDVVITWTVGGAAYPAGVPGAVGPTTTTLAGDTVPAQDTAANQNWICSAVASDAEYASDPGTASMYLAAGPLSDFGLDDVNATSPRFGESVSPRDYLQKVSGWYFGHAT